VAVARSKWPARLSRKCPSSTTEQVELVAELEEISAESLAKQGEEAPVIKLVNVILMSAIQKGASDIHIEPYEKELRVRYRVDGLLYNIMQPPMKLRDAMTSRIKIMAEADIAGKAAAAGRPHQDSVSGRRRDEGNRLPRVVSAHAVSARRSCSASSTRTS
jgi:type II secretory ATPase GspE/PulE/Tfp pilus assembly ATPase PilB-like protein